MTDAERAFLDHTDGQVKEYHKRVQVEWDKMCERADDTRRGNLQDGIAPNPVCRVSSEERPKSEQLATKAAQGVGAQDNVVEVERKMDPLRKAFSLRLKEGEGLSSGAGAESGLIQECVPDFYHSLPPDVMIGCGFATAALGMADGIRTMFEVNSRLRKQAPVPEDRVHNAAKILAALCKGKDVFLAKTRHVVAGKLPLEERTFYSQTHESVTWLAWTLAGNVQSYLSRWNANPRRTMEELAENIAGLCPTLADYRRIEDCIRLEAIAAAKEIGASNPLSPEPTTGKQSPPRRRG